MYYSEFSKLYKYEIFKNLRIIINLISIFFFFSLKELICQEV